jgi:ABC-type transport system involved in multi-copper enzyme maturation permease subunit
MDVMRRPMNPVLARELKERMRNRRTPVTICIYLGVLAGILYLVYQARQGSSVNSFGDTGVSQIATTGRTIFEWLVFFMLLLVLFLVPGFTSGAIAGERERQTLVPLQITLLRPRSILFGKIAASLAFLALLVVATIPLLSVTYLIGGVTIAEVVKATALVLATGVVLACLTAAVSTFVKRVQAATVMAYGLTLLLTLGTFLAYGAAALVDRSRGTDEANPPVALLLPNPLVATADILGRDSGSNIAEASPFQGIKDLLHRNNGDVISSSGSGGIAVPQPIGPMTTIPGGAFKGGFVVRGGVGVAVDSGKPPIGFDPNGNPIFANQDDGVPFWVWSLLLLGGLSALSVAAAARRLRTPSSEER